VPTTKIPLLAAAGASMVTRTAARLAYAEQGRAMVTHDVLGKVGFAFREVFEKESTNAVESKM
jgi:ATP-dependent NAD(P)H-hydrate dehydratase